MLLVRESINSGLLFDLAKLDEEVKDLSAQSEQENFWSNSSEALKVIARLNYCKNLTETYRGLERNFSDLNELLEKANYLSEKMGIDLNDAILFLKANIVKKDIPVEARSK